MRWNRLVSFMLAFVMVVGSVVISPNYTFAEKDQESIPLITFLNENDGFGIFTNINGNENYNEVQVNDVFVEAGLLSVGDRISIDLPDSSRHAAIIDKIDVDINGVYTVRGRFESKEYSYFLISSKDNVFSGLIYLVEDGEQYLINYDGEKNIHHIFNNTQNAMDIVYSEPLIPPMENMSSRNDEIGIEPLSQRNLDELVTIDLMLVYTPAAIEAAKRLGGIDNVIAQAMGKSQLVLDNSKVNINLRLVHSHLTQYKESGSASIDLRRITDVDGYMDEVHQLRDAYGADLVAFVGDIEYSGGLGWVLQNVNGREDTGFTVSSVNVISWSDTLIHEIGHNMGARHSRNQSSEKAPDEGGLFAYSTGWRWTGLSGRSYASVMTYEEGSTRVPIFSNPNVLWDGVPTGSYNGKYAPADNARSLREIKHAIADYRTKTILDIPVKNITLDRTSLYLLTSFSEKLTAKVEPYVSTHDLIWNSSNSSVARVDENGTVTGVSQGTAIITISAKNGSKSASCKVTVENNATIIFPDPILEGKIRDHIVGHKGPILKSNALALTGLYLDNYKITNIEGLQYFTNITNLNMSYNKVQDITPLSDLTKLTELNISNNKVQDIGPLKGLTKLERLHANSNLINDLEPLRGLVNLKVLELSYNSIIDITPLENLTELETITLSSNNITDIYAISNMNKLRYGYFSGNKIKDLSPVKVNINYSRFIFSNNHIYDISPLVINGNDFGVSYGPTMDLESNYLDTREGSQNMKDIQTLMDRNYNVYYRFQEKIIAVGGINLSKSNLELEVGQADKLSVTISPSDATNQDLLWESSDDNIVKVDNKGNITAMSPGQVTITVTSLDGGKKVYCQVTVVKGYDISKEKLTARLANHPWTIKFNMQIDLEIDNVNNDTVYIIDENSNKLDFINAHAENDEDFGYIILKNNGMFEENMNYWIIIEGTIRSFDNEELRKGLKVQFSFEQ